jgi:DNA polymerase III epsilon subunit-like protein
MQHLNGNLLAVVDVETTGLRPGYHDLIQIAVLPLDSTIKPLKTAMPFYLEMLPKRPENMDPEVTKVHRINLAELMQRAICPWKASELFESWFEKLGLPIGKRLSPIAHNWPFDRSFILDWLGEKAFSDFFDARFRDTMSAALFMNDRADLHSEKVPYPKVKLQYLCSQLGVSTDRAHDALQDCISTAEVYKRMISQAF